MLVPDTSVSIADGALVPWSVGSSSFYEGVIQAIADRYEIDTDLPWRDLTEEQQGWFLYGTNGDRILVQYKNRMGRKRQYAMAFEGILRNLERRYRETESSQQRERIEEYMSFRPVPRLQRRPPQAGRARGHGRRPLDPRVHRPVGGGGAPLPRRARADADRGADRPPDREGDPRAAHLPLRRRRRLPPARPRREDAVGRRGAAAAARDADRLPARRRPLHPRRAVDRPPPARQRPPDRDAAAPEGARQHRARRRARRADDARRRLGRRHGPRRRRARRPGRRRGHREAGDAHEGLGHRRLPLRPAHDRDPAAARGRPRRLHDPRRRPAQPEGHRRRVPGRRSSSASPASRAPASRRS